MEALCHFSCISSFFLAVSFSSMGAPAGNIGRVIWATLFMRPTYCWSTIVNGPLVSHFPVAQNDPINRMWTEAEQKIESAIAKTMKTNLKQGKLMREIEIEKEEKEE
ncbi:unnamed protein product [Dovyalis caffra]|uniref:Uncharacterized protein n=1 Tax=Dovyalis caffra TaxID=77055 RepID=A0AAV1RQ05_9ROSI|nr:unnamed protein product [Dovyalis caffra]